MTDTTTPKPRLAYTIATAFGLGYFPRAPGTWGSLLGVLLGWLAMVTGAYVSDANFANSYLANPWLNFAVLDEVFLGIASIAGVWAADYVSEHSRSSDPQIVVIDEVAGQLTAYLGAAVALAASPTFAVNWKYLLLGFILFRVFDIWKPFPARQAESLPGGLGIMADDWIAGVYAALVLLIARRFGF